MDAVFFVLLASGASIGLAMGWGLLSQRSGCAILCSAPFLIFGIIALEPFVTGQRQSSTAGLAIPFGTFWVALAAAAGAIIGAITHWIVDRMR